MAQVQVPAEFIDRLIGLAKEQNEFETSEVGDPQWEDGFEDGVRSAGTDLRELLAEFNLTPDSE